jgi:hypothetical protein
MPLSQSPISEFGRLWPVVELAKNAPEAQTLSVRLARFIDKDAHWAAALYSTQAVDILMRKQIFACLQISCFIILLFIGFFLTFSPIKMERVYITIHTALVVFVKFMTTPLPGVSSHKSRKWYNYREN